jgi:hypothetical protein
MLIPPRTKGTGKTSSKKVFTLPMKKNFLDLASNIIIMIILKLGPKFSYIKLPRWIIHGSSLLIKISLGSFLCGLQTGGLIMV